MQFFYLANTLCFAVLTLAVPISVKLRDQLIKDKGYDFTMELASKLPQHTPSAVACASFYRICHYTCSTNTKSLPYNLGCTTERTSNRTYTLRTRCTCSLPSSQQDEQERQECRDNPIAKPIEGHTDANVDKGEDLIPREMFDDDYDALGGPALTAKDFARGKEVAATGANGDADTELSAGQFEGDIVLPEGSDEFSMHSKLAEAANNSWTNGIVPYTVSNYLTSKHRSVIAGAIDYIQKRTCVRFTKREHEGDWVHFYAGPGCSSPVGRTGGPQYISLGYGCIQEGIGTVVHEVMHALGFVHEQSRPDRDDYVSIQWDNITQGRCSQFQRIDQELDHTAYDYGSVMHYKTDAFGKLKNGSTTEKKVTVRPLKDAAADFEIGQRRAPSSTDVQRICRRYNCGSNCYPDQLPADKQPVQQDEPDKTFLHRKVSPWRTHYGGVFGPEGH